MIFDRGLVIGKFQPIHKGHLSLLRFALSLCNSIDVHVSSDPKNDLIPASERVTALYADLGMASMDAFITPFKDEVYASMPRDKDGTVTDEKYWEWYMKELKAWYKPGFRGSPEVIISSDLYGKEIAKRMGIRWIPYDPMREITSGLSATKIKEDILKGYKDLSPEMRKKFGMTLAILGPESSGKSTLGKRLQEYLTYPTTYVSEYGRVIDVFKGNLDKKDFDVIGKAQEFLIDQARADENYITVTDTEALTTNAFSKLMLGKNTPSLSDIFKKQLKYINLYILLPPVIPFEDDGSRTTKDLKVREAFFDYYKGILEKFKASIYVVKEKDILGRVIEIQKILDKVVQEK